MSTLPPECEQLLISGYVLGNLSPAEALLFEEMLRENPDLIGQITTMQQALDLAYIAPEISPPATLRDRVLAAAKVQKTDVATVKPSVNQADVTHSLPPKLLGKVLAAIALGTIAILGIANYRLWRTIQTLQTDVDSAIVQNTYLLEGENLPKTTTAKLIVNPNQLKAILIASNLPVLPPEKVYALWTVVGQDVPYTTDDKGAILTAVFQVNQSGNFKREIAVPQPHLKPRTINKIAITVEDQSAPQAHTGSIFIATRDKS